MLHFKIGITVSQRIYLFGFFFNVSCLLGSKLNVSPFDPFVKLHQDNGKFYDYMTAYRRLIGTLL